MATEIRGIANERMRCKYRAACIALLLAMVLVGDSVYAVQPVVLQAPEGRGVATAVAFSPNGKILAASHSVTATTLWRVKPASESERLSASFKDVGCFSDHPIVFSPWGDLLATGWMSSITDRNAGVDLWDVETGKLKERLRMDYNGNTSLGYFAFSLDGDQMAVAIDGLLKTWTPSTNEVRTLSAKRGDEELIQFIRYLSDGKRFVTVRKDGQIRFWDATSGRMLTDSKVSTEGFYEIVDKRANGYGGLHSCLVSADGSLASSIFRPGRTIMGPRGGDQLEIWDANDRKAFRAIKLPPKDSVSLIALSEDGKWIATAHGSVLEIWDTKTTRSVGKIPFDRGTEPGMGLTFSKDAQFLASGSSSKVLLWDVSEFTNLAEEKMQAEEPLEPKASPRGK